MVLTKIGIETGMPVVSSRAGFVRRWHSNSSPMMRESIGDGFEFFESTFIDCEILKEPGRE